MPSDHVLLLWWSGASESVFLYYLTGAMVISFCASIFITKSLRRMESRVIELVSDDDGITNTYLLTLTTSILPGSGCPSSVKVFLQLTGDNHLSDYFLLRSKFGGRSMFQRGHVDIFIVTVPGTLGDIKSIELLVSGVEGNLSWKFKDVQLYNPVSRLWRNLPVTITTLELLNQKSHILHIDQTSSWKCWLVKNLLQYHQWLAMFGNTIRLGAFTELVHVLCVFMMLYCQMILSQVFYIVFPRGEYEAGPTDDLAPDESPDGLFNINHTSLLSAAVVTSVGSTVLMLALEVVIRSVKSLEKNPGEAYHAICRDKTLKVPVKPYTETQSQCYIYKSPVYFLPYCNFTDTSDTGSNIHNDKPTVNKPPDFVKLFEQFLKNENEKRESSIIEKSPQWFIKEKKMRNGGILRKKSSEDMFHEMEISHHGTQPTGGGHVVSSLDLNKLTYTNTSSDTSDGQDWDYFSHMICHTTSDIFHDAEDDSDLEHVVIDMPECTNTAVYSILGKEIDRLKTLQDMDATGQVKLLMESVENMKTSDRFVDAVFSANTYEEQYKTNLKTWKEESLLYTENNSAFTGMDWNSVLKSCSRELVKDLCNIIKYMRGRLVVEKCDITEITVMLMKKSQDILYKLVIGCFITSSQDMYDALNSVGGCKLLTHLCMEILVTTVSEILEMLLTRQHSVNMTRRHSVNMTRRHSVNMVDLMMRSHRVMCMIQYCTTVTVYVLTTHSYIIQHVKLMILSNDMHQLLTVILSGCFHLVTKYNLVSWRTIKILMERDICGNIETSCYDELCQCIDENIRNETTSEQTAINRLCNSVEEHAKQELWDDLHNEKNMFTNVLIKCEMLEALKNKITELRNRKQKLQRNNLSGLNEHKTRLQLQHEKRHRQSGKGSVRQELTHTIGKFTKHVSWTDRKHHIEAGDTGNVQSPRTKIKHQDQVIENLTSVRDRLKKVLEKQGLTRTLNGSVLLAQASLHPCVRTYDDTDNDDNNTKHLYTFDNFTKFKRAETTLAFFYHTTANELVQYLLTSVQNQHNFTAILEEKIDTIVYDILVKLDTMVDLLYEDLDNVMHQCIKTSLHCDKHEESHQRIDTAAKCSAVSLIEKSSLIQWSPVDLHHITQSEMSILGKEFNEFSEKELQEIIDFMKETDITESQSDMNISQNAQLASESNEITDTHGRVEELLKESKSLHSGPGIHGDNKVTIQDIINDLKPIKAALELLRTEEQVRSDVTLVRYIERCKKRRDVLCALHLNNTIDSYNMIGEGDCSHTLTSAGLYQLEHDSLYEDLKPLPSWMKVVMMLLMLLLLTLITVYVTMIGGQFTTTELQEWMCYYILSIVLWAVILEPVRACMVGWYVNRMDHYLQHNRAEPSNACPYVVV